MRRIIFGVSIVFLTALTLSACGKQGPQGSQGLIGPQGLTGSTGAAGAPGTNATPVTVVQLCSGCAPAYPSTFAESAVCLQGQLYGVYSANGGFLALLPPGAYSSDGINCSCSFTISAGCKVS